jgi:hypothetical protein
MLTLNATGETVTGSGFEVELGSQLEIKNNQSINK